MLFRSLVQLRPVKRLGLAKIRDLFQTCSMPEQCKEWVDKVEKEVVAKPPYAKIVHTISVGKLDSIIKTLKKENVVQAAMADPNIARHIDGKPIRKRIYVKGKILNLVV